jgi:hypothetical protein
VTSPPAGFAGRQGLGPAAGTNCRSPCVAMTTRRILGLRDCNRVRNALTAEAKYSCSTCCLRCSNERAPRTKVVNATTPIGNKYLGIWSGTQRGTNSGYNRDYEYCVAYVVERITPEGTVHPIRVWGNTVRIFGRATALQ